LSANTKPYVQLYLSLGASAKTGALALAKALISV
jgi:hypothetical protein